MLPLRVSITQTAPQKLACYKDVSKQKYAAYLINSYRAYSRKRVAMKILVLSLIILLVGCQPPGVMVDIGKGELHLNCSSTKAHTPTVMLISGGGDDSTSFEEIQPEIAKFMRVCSYDRGGEGFSDDLGKDDSQFPILQNVENLSKLVESAKLSKPIILVGHSWGGLVARIFASKHPDDVLGIVLLDSAHEDQFKVLPKGYWDGFDKETKDFVRDYNKSLSRITPVGNLSSTPLFVLSAQAPAYSEDWLDSYQLSNQFYQTRVKLWNGLQNDLAASSSNGKRLIMDDDNHYVHQANPKIVIDSIKKIYLSSDGS